MAWLVRASDVLFSPAAVSGLAMKHAKMPFADIESCSAGRIVNKRAGGMGLVFFDLNADGFKLQVFADARKFDEFSGENGVVEFMKVLIE